MAGRDDDDFDWIYGQAGDSTPPSGRPDGSAPSDPEPTRRLPVQRPDGAPSGPPVPPPSPHQHGARPEPAGPPVPPAWSGRRSRWRRPRTWIRLIIGVLVLWLVFLVAVPLVAWKKVDKVDFEPTGDRPADQPGTTYLLVGSDSRAGLSAEERKKLHTGDAKSQLTDTILLLHTGSGPTVLVSIPRDTQVPGKYKSGNGLINGLYSSGGYPLLVRYLEDTTGLRIDDFVEIGFGGLVDVVDAVGGIEICPKHRIRDKPSGLNVKKGCQEVDGTTALAYSRARKYSPLSDLARVQQQREVIAAVGDKVLSPWSVINPVRWWKLNNAVPDFFTFGEGMSPTGAARWALAMSDAPRSCTMPITDPSAHTWDKRRADKLFDAIKEDRTDEITDDLCTPDGLAH